MPAVLSEPVPDTGFDHHSGDFALHWRDTYAGLREACPVVHADAHGGFHVVTRYADVRSALLDSRTFVCGRDLTFEGVPAPVPGGVTIPTNPFRMGMMETDAPVHQQLRRLITPWLSMRSVTEHLPRLRELVTWCLDRVTPLGCADVVADLANPLPALVTLDLLGLPLEKWQWYATTLHGAAYREKGSARQVALLIEDLGAIVRARRQVVTTPTCALDALCLATVDGMPLRDEAVVELVFMLLNGGIDTSTAVIAHLALHLDDHPDDRRALIADRSLIPGFVDELIRAVTPGTAVARTVSAEVVLGGVTLHPGDRVLLALGSADNDPEVYAEPATVQLVARAPGHLAFGTGAHRCVGSFLAPTEIVTLVEELLHRIPDFSLDREAVEPYPTIPLVAGFVRMPMTFTPSPVLGDHSPGELPPAGAVAAASRLAAAGQAPAR